MSSFGLLIPFLPQLEADWLVCGSCGRERDVWYCVPHFAAPVPGRKQEEGWWWLVMGGWVGVEGCFVMQADWPVCQWEGETRVSLVWHTLHNCPARGQPFQQDRCVFGRPGQSVTLHWFPLSLSSLPRSPSPPLWSPLPTYGESFFLFFLK